MKRRWFRGMYCCLGGSIGAPIVTNDRYLCFGHRRGRLRQENAEYKDFRLGRQVFTHENSETAMFQGYVLLFGGSDGGPMVTNDRYLCFGH